MKQKDFSAKSSSTPCGRAAADAEIERLEDLVRILDHCCCSGIVVAGFLPTSGGHCMVSTD